ncbi:transporter substrate-binding domain-containing protein [Cucumibacter marinus]|uniref:transporter substrate-binding domain-containing protein n=1 Tax=Cucumibacter marinus TaxID=1121252 RepID=UPI00048F7479|nr:transporter substrate-binding domain-containing protein [Cucumibacter marinus]
MTLVKSTVGLAGLTLVAGLSLSGVAVAQSAADMLPQKYRDAGVLNVGMVLDYPPYSWIDADSGNPTGLEVDVGLAIGEKLDIEWNIMSVKWEGLITGVGSERFDVGAGGTSDLEEREKVVTFIDYAATSEAVIVLAKNAEIYPDMDALCGKSIGALKGTTTATVAEDLAKECADKGLDTLHVNLYTSVPDADLALQSGRDAAQVGSTEQASFIMMTGGQDWHIVRAGIGATPMGPFVSVKRPDLAEAILAALKELRAEGKLTEIAAKYGLDGSIVDPMINMTTAQ